MAAIKKWWNNNSNMDKFVLSQIAWSLCFFALWGVTGSSLAIIMTAIFLAIPSLLRKFSVAFMKDVTIVIDRQEANRAVQKPSDNQWNLPL